MNRTALAPNVALLVVDDSQGFRDRVKRLLASDPSIEVVGEASDGLVALLEIARLRPDLILLDLHMPAHDGFGVLRIVKERFPQMKVIVLTNDPSASTVQRCAALQADAVIDKANASIRVIPTVRLITASIDRSAV